MKGVLIDFPERKVIPTDEFRCEFNHEVVCDCMDQDDCKICPEYLSMSTDYDKVS